MEKLLDKFIVAIKNTRKALEKRIEQEEVEIEENRQIIKDLWSSIKHILS